MEVLLHTGTQISGRKTLEIHDVLLRNYGISNENYNVTQLRYDIRKMKAHGLVERDGKHYRYRLTEKGHKVALMFACFKSVSVAPYPTLFLTINLIKIYNPIASLKLSTINLTATYKR